MTILYIPVVSLFTSMFLHCSDGPDSGSIADAVNCWSGIVTLRSITVLIVSILYVSLSLIFALSVFQQDPTDHTDHHGRPHSRIEVFNLVSKTVLTITFTILERGKRYVRYLLFLF